MVNLLIAILIYACVFFGVAWAMKWCCDNFKLPVFAYWVCGIALIIVLLLAISGQIVLPYWPNVPTTHSR